jgi:hypothetical protein
MLNNSEWSNRIREEYKRQTGNVRSVRFPESGIEIRGNVKHVSIHLPAQSVTKNLQTNAAAFEGWALALMRWCGVRRININWDNPERYIKTDPKNRHTRQLHYNRFLYRVERFSQLLNDCVTVVDRSRLKGTAYKNAKRLCFNVGKGRDTAGELSMTPEAKLEKEIVSRGIKKFGIEPERLDRQFPVGVFDGLVSKDTAIFSGNKSAIDLVGLDRKGDLWIFELKAEGNLQIGSISELFFYSVFMRDALRPNSRFSALKESPRLRLKPADFEDIRQIHACLLAPEPHPLIDITLLELLNSAARGHQWAIDYQYADLSDYLNETTSVTVT